MAVIRDLDDMSQKKMIYSRFLLLLIIILFAHSAYAEKGISDITGSILINIYEEYGKSGFFEYTLSLPGDVITESKRGKQGVSIKHPVRLPMLGSEGFASIYKTKMMHDESMRDKHEDSFIFGNDRHYEYSWDISGQKMAYSTSEKEFGDHSILVVKDISRNDTLFRHNLNDKSIIDIAWNSSGQHLAVLSAIFTYSKNPISLLITLGGHPVGYRVYYLNIFDISGNHVYQSKENDIREFSAGRGSGLGAVVWLDNEHEN